MSRSIEYIQVDELEEMTATDLHNQVEKVQEENWRLEALVEEARQHLEDLISADEEEVGEILTNVREFLDRHFDSGSF
jgi:hypothetical protein